MTADLAKAFLDRYYDRRPRFVALPWMLLPTADRDEDIIDWWSKARRDVVTPKWTLPE